MIKQAMTESILLTVEDDIWIGDGMMILSSYKRTGKSAILGARTVIASDVPDYVVVTGHPGKVIKLCK